jgi:hypothetical protein
LPEYFPAEEKEPAEPFGSSLPDGTTVPQAPRVAHTALTASGNRQGIVNYINGARRVKSQPIIS